MAQKDILDTNTESSLVNIAKFCLNYDDSLVN